MTAVDLAAPALPIRSDGKPSAALGITGGVILGLIVLVSLLAPWIAPYDPAQQDLLNPLAPPGTDGHLLGTDGIGRDVLSRALWGGRVSLVIALVSSVVSTLIGILIGLLSGYAGRWLDQILGRLADIQLSIPTMLLAILAVAFVGPSVPVIVGVLVLASWPGSFRIARAYALGTRSAGYVEATQLAGGSGFRIVLTHLLPGMLPIVLVNLTLGITTSVLVVASLGFLGLGVPPPTPDWGAMVAAGQTQLAGAWWLSIVPGAFLFLTLIGSQLLGDWFAERSSLRSLGSKGPAS